MESARKFDKMKNSDAPVVFVTATATEEMIGHIKQLSGPDVSPENITWPGSEGIQHRAVMVEVRWKEQVIRNFKDLASSLLEQNDFTKIIVCANSKAKSDELASKIRGISVTRGFLATSLMLTATFSKSKSSTASQRSFSMARLATPSRILPTHWIHAP